MTSVRVARAGLNPLRNRSLVSQSLVDWTKRKVREALRNRQGAGYAGVN